MRIRGATTDLESAGEDVSGMASSVSELREEILALTGGQVDVMIDSENFKSTYDILKELAGVWDELSDIGQANILELIAGKQRGNQVAAILSNWEAAESSLEAAMDSTGSAVQENERYLDSIAGKSAQLKAAFEQLSNTLLNSDIIKFFLDLGIGATDAANGVAELTGVLPILTTALSTLAAVKLGAFEGFLASSSKSSDFVENVKALSTMQTTLGQTIGAINTKMVISSPPELDDFIAKVSTLTDSQKSLALSLVDWQAGSKEANIALKAQAESTLGVTTATRAATVAQLAWNTAVAAFKTIGIGLAIGAITWGIQSLIKAFDEWNVTLEESAELAGEAKSNYEDQSRTIEELTQKLEDLANAKATAHSPEELAAIEAENQKLEAQLILTKELAAIEAKKANQNASKVLYSDSYQSSRYTATPTIDAMSGTVINTVTHESINAFEKLDELEIAHNQKAQEIANLYSQVTEGMTEKQREELQKQINNAEEQLQQIKDEYTQVYGDASKAFENVVDDGSEVYQKMVDDFKAASDDYARNVKQWNGSTDEIIQKNKEAAESFEDFIKSSAANEDEFTKQENAVINLINALNPKQLSAYNKLNVNSSSGDIATTLGFSDESMETLSNWADKFDITIQQVIDGIIDAKTESSDFLADVDVQLDKLDEKLDETQEGYQTVRAALDEYNEYGIISVDTLQALNQLYPEYTACLYDENGQLTINADTLNTVKNSYIELTDSIYDEIDALNIEAALRKTKAIVDNETAKQYLDQAAATKEAAKEMSASEQLVYDTQKQILEDAISNPDNADDVSFMVEAFDDINEELSKSLSSTQEIRASIRKNTDETLNYTSKLKDANKDQDDANNKIHDAIGAWTDLYNAMQEYNTYGQISYSTLNTLLQSYPELTSCLVENGDELTINTSKLRDLIESQLMLEVSQEDATNTADEYARMLEWIDENAMSDTLTLAQLQDMIKGVGTAMEESRSAVQGYDSALTSVMQELLSYDPTDGTFYDQDHINRIYEMESALAGFGDVLSYDTDTKQVQLDYEALKERTIDAIDDEIEAAQAAGDKVTEAMLAATKTAIEKGDKEAIEYWVETGEVLDAVSISLDEFQTNYNDLIDITEEYNRNGELSQDSWQKLLAMGPQYVACLEMEGDQLVFNKEKYVDLYKAQLQFMIGILETLHADEELIQGLKDLVDGIEDADIHFGRSTDALEKYKEALSKLGDVFDSVLNLIDKGLEAAQDNLQEAADNLQIIGDAIIDEIQDRIDALEDQKDAQDQYYEDEIGNLEDLKDAMEDANEEQERAIELARLQDALARAKANRTVRKYVEGQGYIWTTDEDAVKQAEQDLSDQIRDWNQEDANAAIDDQIDKIQQDQEEAGNAIDDQIAKLEELKDKYSEVMDLIGMDWDEYQAMLKAQAEASGMTLDEMEANLDDYRNSVVQNMKDVEEVSDTQEEIEGIRNFIDTLKEVWSVISVILDIIEILSGGTDFLTTLKKAIGRLFGGDEGGEGEGIEGESGNAFTNVIDNAKNFFTNIGDVFKTGFDGLLDKGGVFLEGLKTKFGTFFGNFNLDVSGFIDTVKNLFSGGWDKITTGASGFIQNLISKFTTGFPGIEQLASTFIQNVTGFFSNGFPQITNIVSTFFTNLPNIFSGGLSNILGTVTGWLGNLGTIFSGGLSSLASTVSGIIGNLGGIGTALGGVGAAISSAAPVIAGGAVAVGGAIIGNKVGNTLLKNSEKHFDEGKYVQAGFENAVAGIFKPVESIVNSIKNIGSLLGFASGTKSVPYSSVFNVDEKGPELLLKRPAQGRYTYLEAGDGVVPADMTKNIFAMAKNPEEWFRKQLRANSIAQTTMGGGTSSIVTIGDIYINKPVGNSDQLALAIKQELPNKMRQELGKR